MASARKSATAQDPHIGHLRLVSQRILGSSFGDPAQVVAWMLAMQAQAFDGAKWAIGLRTGPEARCTDADVEAAISSGRIVRSWPMRGTLHFTVAEDLKWMLALTAPRMVASAAARRAALDLIPATLERARAVVLDRLQGGRALTRAELLGELAREGISTAGQRGYHILWHLAHTGTLCFGPTRRGEQTFVVLDDWVRHPRLLDRDEALGEWALRYFTSHGPATVRDFGAWTKLTAADVKIGLGIARPHLRHLVVDGVTYFMATNAEDLLEQAGPSVRSSVSLLPGFDEYVLGYQERGAVLAAEHKQRVVPGGNGIFMPTLVVGGSIVGIWRRQTKANENLITPLPFRKISAHERRGLTAAANAYGKFIGRTTRLTELAAPDSSASTPSRRARG